MFRLNVCALTQRYAPVERYAHVPDRACTVWDEKNYDDKDDLLYAPGAYAHTVGSRWEIRGGELNTTSNVTLKQQIEIQMGTSTLRVTWRFALGYCDQFGQLGQGTAPTVSLLIDGVRVWQSSINMATEDISGDGNCGGDGWLGGSMSPPKTFSVDVTAMTGKKSLQFKFQNTERNIHFKLDKIALCSQQGAVTLVTATCTCVIGQMNHLWILVCIYKLIYTTLYAFILTRFTSSLMYLFAGVAFVVHFRTVSL